MPQYARLALIQKMERSGLLDRLANDVRILFHKRLRFAGEGPVGTPGRIEVPLKVGAITLGHVSMKGSTRPGRNEIAYASGFQSLSQFNRRFKVAEGISPSAYRRRSGDGRLSV